MSDAHQAPTAAPAAGWPPPPPWRANLVRSAGIGAFFVVLAALYGIPAVASDGTMRVGGVTALFLIGMVSAQARLRENRDRRLAQWIPLREGTVLRRAFWDIGIGVAALVAFAATMGKGVVVGTGFSVRVVGSPMLSLHLVLLVLLLPTVSIAEAARGSRWWWGALLFPMRHAFRLPMLVIRWSAAGAPRGLAWLALLASAAAVLGVAFAHVWLAGLRPFPGRELLLPVHAVDAAHRSPDGAAIHAWTAALLALNAAAAWELRRALRRQDGLPAQGPFIELANSRAIDALPTAFEAAAQEAPVPPWDARAATHRPLAKPEGLVEAMLRHPLMPWRSRAVSVLCVAMRGWWTLLLALAAVAFAPALRNEPASEQAAFASLTVALAFILGLAPVHDAPASAGRPLRHGDLFTQKTRGWLRRDWRSVLPLLGAVAWATGAGLEGVIGLYGMVWMVRVAVPALERIAELGNFRQFVGASLLPCLTILGGMTFLWSNALPPMLVPAVLESISLPAALVPAVAPLALAPPLAYVLALAAWGRRGMDDCVLAVSTPGRPRRP